MRLGRETVETLIDHAKNMLYHACCIEIICRKRSLNIDYSRIETLKKLILEILSEIVLTIKNIPIEDLPECCPDE